MVRSQVRGRGVELELLSNEGPGGGRPQLLDTVTGSELGFDLEDRTAFLDLNFAYNPSCSYNETLVMPPRTGGQHTPLLRIPADEEEEGGKWMNPVLVTHLTEPSRTRVNRSGAARVSVGVNP